MVQAGDAEPGVEPAGFDCAGAEGGGEVREELFGCEEGGVVVVVLGGVGGGSIVGVAVASGYSASSDHAVEHCFDVAYYGIRTRGGA